MFNLVLPLKFGMLHFQSFGFHLLLSSWAYTKTWSGAKCWFLVAYWSQVQKVLSGLKMTFL